MASTPNDTRSLAEPLALLVTGALCTVASRQAAVLHWFGSWVDNALVEPVAIRQTLYLYGVALLLGGLLSLLLNRQGSSIVAWLMREWNERESRHRLLTQSHGAATGTWYWIAVAGLLCSGLIARAWFLDQPMRYDESSNFLVIVDGAFYKSFLYRAPNNHVLNSMLEKLSSGVFGPTPIGIRLPAFVSGLFLALATFLTARRLTARQGGWFALLFVALCPFLILYSTNGRGYSLMALLVVLIVQVSLEPDGRTPSARWGFAALLSALGMLVMPTMLYALGGLALWLAIIHASRSGSWKGALTTFLLPYGLATSFLSLVFYTPVLLLTGGTRALTSNRFVQPMPLHEFFPAAGIHVLQTLLDFGRDVPLPLVLLTTALTIWGIRSAQRDGNRAQAWLLPAMLVGSFVLFVAKRSVPFTRTWIYLLPIMAVAADAGAVDCYRRLPAKLKAPALLACLLLGGGIGASLVANASITEYPDTGTFPQARAVADYLARDLSAGDVVCAELPADTTTAYYLWRDLKPSDYRARAYQARLFLLHLGPPITDADWNDQQARILSRTDDYVLYDWTAMTGKPSAIVHSTCWSPARQAGMTD